MADKGFELKVLVPTEDGINISSIPVEDTPYFLMYNLSNRSYQLAGKIKLRELLTGDGNMVNELDKIIVKEKVDVIISEISNPKISCKFFKSNFKEINKILHSLIDKLDQKEELF